MCLPLLLNVLRMIISGEDWDELEKKAARGACIANKTCKGNAKSRLLI